MANHVRPIVVSAADQAELERLQRSSAARAGVSRRVRAVLLMVQGLSGVEIAERTGLTPGSVRVNLHRGMKMLRDKLHR